MVKLKSTKAHVNPLFKIGSSVEVRSTDPGLHGSWYEAIVISETPRQLRSKLTVQYKTLLSRRSRKEKASPFLLEKVRMSLIRPPSPLERDRNAVFEAFEEVEAYHNDGWWPGVILEKMNEIGDDGSFNYNVAFPLSREVFSFAAYDLRKKMVWVDDEQGYSWKSVDQLCNCDHDSEEELYKTTFHVGAQVEVSYDKDSFGACWFVATILKIIGRTYSLVEYDTLRAENNDSSNPSLEEVVDMQYIRPCPAVKMSEPTRSFKVLDKVEASYNSGWYFGIVSAILPNSTHVVRISEQNKEVSVLINPAALRIPFIWEDGQWNEIFQDKDDKVVRRSKGKKFKRSKTGVTDILTNDQLTQPIKKLKKIKDINGSLHKSSSPHDNDGNSIINHTVPSLEKHLKSKKVCHDSTLNHRSLPPPYDKDGQSLVNNYGRSSKRHLPFKDDHHDSPNFVKNTLLSKGKYPSSLKDKADVGPKAPISHLPLISSEAYRENASTLIESVIQNAEIFEEIIDLDVVEANHGIQNESASDKGLSNVAAMSKALMNRENGMECKSIFDKGSEYALSSLMIHNNFESPVSMELVESTKEVLRLFPQNPHFQPLLHYGKVAKKGMICGLVIGFTTLVNSIQDLTICSSDIDFEEKNNELPYFEQFGFNTRQVRARLKKLEELHYKITRSQEKITSTLSKVEELKEKIACNHKEITKKIIETKEIEFEVEELRSTALAAEDESIVLKLEFGEKLKLPW